MALSKVEARDYRPCRNRRRRFHTKASRLAWSEEPSFSRNRRIGLGGHS